MLNPWQLFLVALTLVFLVRTVALFVSLSRREGNKPCAARRTLDRVKVDAPQLSGPNASRDRYTLVGVAVDR
jgi:hypothetical protein